MSNIPKACVKNIVKESSNCRVSEEATIYLKEVLEENGANIARRASELAKFAGRKTIKKEDIRLALNNY